VVVRIQNADSLTSHGNVKGKRDMVDILEAGLVAADPYENTRRLIRRDKDRLIVGRREFEPQGTPKSGDEILDLSRIEDIYVFGAGKGCQRVAKAIEDKIGDRLSGGHIIDKRGHGRTLERIEVTLGGHPAPYEDNRRGCERIMEMAETLTERDLVFTIVCNGVSSLLTMPVPGVSIEDLRKTTYLMQIDRGAPTTDLNPIRNHLDMMKGGRLSKHIHPAKMIHILAYDPGSYDQLMHKNLWLHTLPDCTTFEDAREMLNRWDAWDEAPDPVRRHLEDSDPEYETVKADEFEQMNFRIFGVMPWRNGMVSAAMRRAEELGYRTIRLVDRIPKTPIRFGLRVEASEAGIVMGTIAMTIEAIGQPFEPPCALFTSGELLVTVGKAKGVGGRNQEFALSAALRIAGSRNVVVGSVDTDGTDGPGTQFHNYGGEMPCLAGGIVDGETILAAERAGIDIHEELKNHNSTFTLWKLKSGVVATPNISLGDLGVILVLDRS